MATTLADATAGAEAVVVERRSLDERFAREARMVGIRDFRTPSLEAVERRRSELWTMAFLAMVGLAIGVVLLSITSEKSEIVRSPGFRAGLVVFTMAIAVYVLEKERHLRRLTRLLLDERILTAALSNRLKELATLCEVGKAVNSVLDVEQVLGIILNSATELLEGSSGSVMLFDDPERMRVVCELGNAAARGATVRIGEGIAGQVALLQEPMLITGTVDRRPSVAESRELTVSTAMCVPLVNRGEVLGVLNVNGTNERRFTEYDLRALTLFAEHASIAIANARLYEAELEHVAELVELDRMKSEFVATVSHELRTPLTSILGCARTMQRRELAPEVTSEFLAMMERQGTRLLHLIEDILDVQRTSMAEAPPPCGPVPLDVVLDEVVRVQAATGRHVTLHTVPPLVVLADRPSLERVFTNLVDNAFSHGGGEVEIEMEQTTHDGAEAALVSVLDRGPGVPPEDTERVFDRFKRGPDAFSPGMGLGLYMVRSLVEAQGGRVWVMPRPGGGAAFRVLLPCAHPEE